MIRLPARSALRVKWHVRGIQTGHPTPPQYRAGTVATHLGAAAAGGGAILAGAYAYYHYSGMAAIVNKARAVKTRYNQVRDAYKEQRPRNAAEALAFLRSISRSRSGPVPDTFVDMVAQFQGDHEEDIDRIVFGACDDIQAIVRESRVGSGPESDGAMGEEGLTAGDRKRIAVVVQKWAGELRVYIRERRRQGDDGEKEVSDSRVSRLAQVRWGARHKKAQPGSEDDESP